MVTLGYTYALVFNGETYGMFCFCNLQRHMLAVGVFGGIVEYFSQATHEVESVGMNV